MKGSKRMSAVIRDIDFNAYRAFKNVTNEKGNHSERNPYNILKGGNNLMRFPFGLKEQRFRWQTSKNIAETTELTGTMFRRKDLPSTNGRWENLINRTEDNITNSATPTRASSTRMRKIHENELGARTITPDLDSSAIEAPRFCKKFEPGMKKSAATGSISNLLNSTPETEPLKSTKRYNIRTSSMDNQGDGYKKLKVAVNLENVRANKEYAGKVYATSREISRNCSSGNLNNAAKQKKIENLTSNIFTPVETQTVLLQRKGKFVDPNKYITTKNNHKQMERNNSYIGKRQYDFKTYNTQDNIFPSSNISTIHR